MSGELAEALRQRDQARAELVRVHTDVWAATNDVRIMGCDGETAVRMVRAALVAEVRRLREIVEGAP